MYYVTVRGHIMIAQIRRMGVRDLTVVSNNCGIDGSVVVDEVSQKPTNTGYDANAGKYVDMVKAGIIDPTKVVRIALENAHVGSCPKVFLTQLGGGAFGRRR